MGTLDIRRSRTAIGRRLGTAALASAIALALFLPATPGAWSGTASQPARTSGSTGIARDAVHALIQVLGMISSRETGCCA
jgi:hypothetical protein